MKRISNLISYHDIFDYIVNPEVFQRQNRRSYQKCLKNKIILAIAAASSVTMKTEISERSNNSKFTHCHSQALRADRADEPNTAPLGVGGAVSKRQGR
jgi:hypothetical protein